MICRFQVVSSLKIRSGHDENAKGVRVCGISEKVYKKFSVSQCLTIPFSLSNLSGTRNVKRIEFSKHA